MVSSDTAPPPPLPRKYQAPPAMAATRTTDRTITPALDFFGGCCGGIPPYGGCWGGIPGCCG
ncbi:hypothetical protein [Streptomyces sp. H27-G5]|uniref:hypothetical protein n=1 Tax=Streptomyces sp. H27-G5 TaxID=2996698 RepID=UPI002D1E3B54|nr:hypothetical protein [Streptomyces sp. H27-G5]